MKMCAITVKKLLVLLTTLFVFVQSIFLPSSAIFIGEIITDNSAVIYDYFEKIDDQDWSGWADLYADAVRNTYVNLIENPENFENNVGILAVNSAQVVDVEKVDDSYVQRVYGELDCFLQNPQLFDCYKVSVNMQVDAESRYFGNGTNYLLLTLVLENGVWKMGAMSYCPRDLLNQYELQYGFLNPRTEPAIIYFLDENGVIRSSTFTEFIVNGTCNEVGNMGYNIEALKANAMAVKMVGWYCVWAGYFISEGYDIPFGWVACMSYYTTNEANTQFVRNAVNAISGYRMVTSTGLLFYASYYAGEPNGNGQYSGQLRQNGCQYLADREHKNWMEILHYYYDYSCPNSDTSVGIIQITNDALLY